MSAVDFGVQRQHMHHDLDFVVEAFREQRTHRAVDQARGQRFQLARAAFTLEEAARDLAGGIGLLDVVDGEGEEVLARPSGSRPWRPRWPAPRCLPRRRSTAPPDWRAISPVSRRTVMLRPRWKVFVTLLNMLMSVSPVVGARLQGGADRPGTQVARRDAIPAPLHRQREHRWNDTSAPLTTWLQTTIAPKSDPACAGWALTGSRARPRSLTCAGPSFWRSARCSDRRRLSLR